MAVWAKPAAFPGRQATPTTRAPLKRGARRMRRAQSHRPGQGWRQEEPACRGGRWPACSLHCRGQHQRHQPAPRHLSRGCPRASAVKRTRAAASVSGQSLRQLHRRTGLPGTRLHASHSAHWRRKEGRSGRENPSGSALGRRAYLLVAVALPCAAGALRQKGRVLSRNAQTRLCLALVPKATCPHTFEIVS